MSEANKRKFEMLHSSESYGSTGHRDVGTCAHVCHASCFSNQLKEIFRFCIRVIFVGQLGIAVSLLCFDFSVLCVLYTTVWISDAS